MKTVLRIGIFIAIISIATGCIKDDDPQLRITFTDIPAEYNGLSAQSWLVDAGSGVADITNGKITVYYSKETDYFIYYLNSSDLGKYTVQLLISENIQDPEGDYTIWHWGGEGEFNITKTSSTISFKSLKKFNDVSFPFTDYGSPPSQIKITDIPAELCKIERPLPDIPVSSDYFSTYGFGYLLKPDNRELYAYSFPYDYEIKNGENWPFLRRVNAPPYDLDRGKYIVVFKIKKEKRIGIEDFGETIYWEGESEPIELLRRITTISFNSFKQWDRSYPYETDQTDQTDHKWKDRDK